MAPAYATQGGRAYRETEYLDEAIEELFVLVARVGIEQVAVLLSPYDFRQHAVPHHSAGSAWVETLYGEIQRGLGAFTPTPQ